MKYKNKNILIDLERLRYPNSGIANVFRNLALGFLKLPTLDNLDISLYGPQNTIEDIETTFAIQERKPIHKIRPFSFFKYDLLHTSHQLSSYFHHKIFGQKKVVTLHDLNFLHEDITEKKYKKELKKVKRNICNADVIVCISEFAKQDLIKNFHLFKLATKPDVRVVYNGIKFPNTGEEFVFGEEYQYLKNKKYILNIGVLFPKKNQLSLVRMLPYIEEDLVLVVSSENQSYAKEITDEIETLGLKDRVHYCHNISNEQKWAFIQNCSSMCHPSIAEGFGIPPIEAMGFGKPVFLSNRTSLPEVGGEVAFYFNDFDTESMVAVYKKGMKAYYENKQDYVDKYKKWSQNFDYKTMAKNYLEIYKEVLSVND